MSEQQPPLLPDPFILSGELVPLVRDTVDIAYDGDRHYQIYREDIERVHSLAYAALHRRSEFGRDEAARALGQHVFTDIDPTVDRLNDAFVTPDPLSATELAHEILASRVDMEGLSEAEEPRYGGLKKAVGTFAFVCTIMNLEAVTATYPPPGEETNSSAAVTAFMAKASGHDKNVICVDDLGDETVLGKTLVRSIRLVPPLKLVGVESTIYSLHNDTYYLDQRVCSAIDEFEADPAMHPDTFERAMFALYVGMHEDAHAGGVSSEKEATCLALDRLPEAIINLGLADGDPALSEQIVTYVVRPQLAYEPEEYSGKHC